MSHLQELISCAMCSNSCSFPSPNWSTTEFHSCSWSKEHDILLVPSCSNLAQWGYHWLLPLLCQVGTRGRNTISMQYTAAGTFTLGGFTPAISYNCSISADNSQGSGPLMHRVVTTPDDGKYGEEE